MFTLYRRPLANSADLIANSGPVSRERLACIFRRTAGELAHDVVFATMIPRLTGGIAVALPDAGVDPVRDIDQVRQRTPLAPHLRSAAACMPRVPDYTPGLGQIQNYGLDS